MLQKQAWKILSQLHNISGIVEIESKKIVEVPEEQLEQRQQFEEMEKYNDVDTQSKSDPYKIYTFLQTYALERMRLFRRIFLDT